MKISDIRSFRRNLRLFDRLNQLSNMSCCRGVTVAQCHVLLEMEILGDTTTKRLSEILSLDKSTLSRTIDSLKQSGFVKRDENPDDRRYTILSLTNKGKAKCDNLNKYNDTLFIDIFKRLSPKDLDCFFRCFDKVVKAQSEYHQQKCSCN